MANSPSKLSERPPVVVVMGHVDHGKSSLLDYIRKTNVVATESGGITQHVAAYEVTHEKDGAKKRITFIDTPGHAAFSAIRARGANVADLAVLVVAADDGVKAQTLEALKSIRESKTPFVVAINKIDKPNADIERTKATLLENEVFLETLGGDVPWALISAKTGKGIPELLDLILIAVEMEQFVGDAAIPAEGYIIEASRDPKRGISATLIIKNGSMKTGMALVAGTALAPLRIMEDATGKALREAQFSSPVRVVGWSEIPEVGAPFKAYMSKRDAEAAVAEASREKPRQAVAQHSDAQFSLPIVVKADAVGSLEAILGELTKIGNAHARITVIVSGVGAVSENDVKTAIAAQKDRSLIVAFRVPIEKSAIDLAEQHTITTESFDIIYKLTERLTELLKERTPKQRVEEVIGKIRVLKQFSRQKEVQVIGGKVESGRIEKKRIVRIWRRGALVGEGEVLNLQAARQNVAKVEAPAEFGTQIEAVMEIAPGDLLECIVEIEK
ncbi:MAG: GTP-binding protein [Parcubacteria group bacterium]|nr:GTP-binding protein [Parcubacteria group bacterium]